MTEESEHTGSNHFVDVPQHAPSSIFTLVLMTPLTVRSTLLKEITLRSLCCSIIELQT